MNWHMHYELAHAAAVLTDDIRYKRSLKAMYNRKHKCRNIN